MSLDTARLENKKLSGGRTTARCPACSEVGDDSAGNHLFINADSKFGCVMYQGYDGAEHRKRIFQLIGIPIEKETPAYTVWTALPAAPENAPFPSLNHFKHGKPAAHWLYRTAAGKSAGIIARFNLPNGKKETLPLAWCKSSTGQIKWHWKAMHEPRPLLNLPFTEDFIVLVEGEKCADAITDIGIPVTTWSGGSGAVAKSDFTSLAGKIVILWPDNDEPGTKCMDEIKAILFPIVSALKCVTIPPDMPAGWDAADTSAEHRYQLIEDAPEIFFQSAKPKTANDDSEIFQAYYDGSRFHLDNGRDYVPMDCRSLKAHLKRGGVIDVEAEICSIQVSQYVKYIGPLAGKRRGVYECNGNLILASSNPRIIPSEPGAFPTIQNFIQKLLGGDIHETEQLTAFMGWMHIARRAMIVGKRRPGQALVLAGPIACGKTQLIHQIIVPSMGGRQARPYKYLSGKTGFNSDLLGSEVLVIDDEAASNRIESRRALGEGIKSNIFGSAVRIEGKFREGFDFDPLWRIVFAVNDQPESLMVLPPLSVDISDKIIIFKCHKALEMSDSQFEAWQRQIRIELPAFLHAVENFEIPAENTDGRCGIKCFYHPEILAAISELSPEQQLRNLINDLEASGGISLPWVGTAAMLKGALTAQGSPVRSDAEKLLGSWISACGVYLSRLESQNVEKLPLLDGAQRWRVSLPSGQVDTIPDSSFGF